jgi:hypothetical protein
MFTRLWIGLVTVFWVVMSFLLWRSEFGGRRQIASSIPPAVVWKKILTAPDLSTLEIRHGTNRIGYCKWRPPNCKWRPGVGQEMATGARMLEDEPLEGMVQQLANYTLDFDGNMTLPDFPARLRFSSAVKLDTNYAWQTFEARIQIRPDEYQLAANAADQTVTLHVDAGADKIDRVFRFADFQNPQRLLLELGGPMLPAMAATMGLPLSTNKLSTASLGLRWQARNDSLLIGGNRVRAYRLEAKPLDRFKVTIYVSPVGEILRAELPGNLVFVNDQLAGLRNQPDHD